jgi:hypothetical protein
MDHKKLIQLQKNGLIDKCQQLHTNTRTDIVIKVGNNKYIAKPTGQSNQYQLKLINNELFIANINKNIELIKFQDNDEFLEITGFYLVYDEISCSIVPCNNTQLLLCYTNNIISFKKYLACLNKDTTTVFPVYYNIKERPIPKKQPVVVNNTNNKIVEKNLVPLSEINILKPDNFQWLDIVTNNNKNIPEYLYSRIFKYRGYYPHPSILYLKYIINNYNNLPSKVCFINNNPIVSYIDVNQKKSFKIEDFIMGKTPNIIDMRINLSGDRIRYRNEQGWTNWQNYKDNITAKINQQTFWAHIVKIIPKNSYIEYSSANTRLVESGVIKQYTRDFYVDMYDKYNVSKTYPVEFLDRIWDTIFIYKNN